MSSVKLKFNKESNTFGTTVYLSNKLKTINHLVVQDLDFNPIKNNKSTVKTGSLFRSPDIKVDDLAITLRSLRNISGNFNLSVEYDKKTEMMTAFIRFADKSDAALFGWSNIEVWQKWSDQKQEEAEKAKKQKPPKLKVGKDGKITVTVVAETLDE